MLDLGKQVEAAAAGHRKIEDDGVEWFRERSEGGIAAVRLGDKNAGKVIVEDRAHATAYNRMVIDEQDPLHCAAF